ncbi:MAG: type II toxin-antitoxin system HicB family antitoxin [Nitrospinae bacterium]|nr:type II toxin-antitoxin system HicB family antitoxin [Nitrospinota bacterium]
MKIMYPANIVKGEDGIYTVTFPDFPEAVTDGATLEEALHNASEALTLTLEGRMEEGMEIPSPKERGRHLVAPAARVQSAVLLKMARGKRTVAEIARALGTSWPAAQKLEDPRHSPTLKQLEKAAAAMGKKLLIEIEG